MTSLLAASQSIEWAGEIPPVDNKPSVFVIHVRNGQPYLARTNLLKRRLTRLLGGSKLMDLRAIATRIDIWYTPTKLEQLLVFYQLAKQYFPETYRKTVHLPSPPYVKLLLSNAFPRTQVTTRLAGKESLFYGPFRNRAEAERWEGEMLDFFQIRRCEEDLEPHPDHAGCMYGEMGQCLRPCQLNVGPAEYASEVKRLEQFLDTNGTSLIEAIGHARDRASDNLEFEEAARQHKRHERVEALLRSSSEITGNVRYTNGVSAVRNGAGVDLWFLLDGLWADPVRLEMTSHSGESMDRRLREVVAGLPERKPTLKDREEHLALLSRWYFSSWRDSEWLPFANREEVPYRKLVRLISRSMSHANMNLYDNLPTGGSVL